MDRPPRPDFSARKRTEGSRVQDRLIGPDGRRQREDRRNRMSTILILVAAVWSLGLVIAAVALPVYNGESITNANGVTFVSETLVAQNGAWVLIPVAVPLVVCGVVALALRRKRALGSAHGGRVAWAAIGLLGVFTLLSIPSIGLVIIPVVILLARAVTLSAPPADEAPAPVSPAAAAPTAPDPGRPAHLW
jgi:fatty acid desaturase